MHGGSLILERGQRRLPQADAAIVGRDCGVGPDPNASRVRAFLGVVEQHLILEDAAGEHAVRVRRGFRKAF
jgi:hypothetical protein